MSTSRMMVVVTFSLFVVVSFYKRADSRCGGNFLRFALPLLGGAGCEVVPVGDDMESQSATNVLRRFGENQGGNVAGMRLSMARRDSHPSPKVSLQNSLGRDSDRFHRIVERILLASAPVDSSRSRYKATFPDLTNPGGKKEQATNESSGNSSSGVHKFESSVVSGVPLGSGEYFMDLYVGTPPTHFSVIIDSGSDLTWIQCDPCQSCYEQQGAVFKPSLSSSYRGLTCDSESCIAAGGRADDPFNCQAGSKKPDDCKYFYYYGDSSNTTGDYALETVTFNVSRGDPLQIEQILFGCGHSNKGLFQGAGGLLGLGQGSISFVSQVGQLFGNKFSYCLVDRENLYNLTSPLIFGDDDVYPRLQSELQWTPFLTDTPMETFYYINITGVSVAGNLLTIPESAWQFDPEGYGGTIIDSGTTLSYFREEAYSVIKKAFEDRISLPIVTTVPVLDLCYNLTEAGNYDFPSFSITFKENVILDFPLKNYFIRPDPEENVYCLAVLGGPSAGMNILGNFQQQNYLVVYDLKNVRLGFAPQDCSAVL